MKKAVLWSLGVFGLLVVFGGVSQALKSPEERAAAAERYALAEKEREARKAQERAAALLEVIVEPARDTVELAYIQHVKDPAASHVSCQEAKFEGRFFVRCGVAYGSPDAVDRGIWEASEVNGSLVLYAMNGDALRALEKIGQSDVFQSGAGHRPPVDTVALAAEF